MTKDFLAILNANKKYIDAGAWDELYKNFPNEFGLNVTAEMTELLYKSGIEFLPHLSIIYDGMFKDAKYLEELVIPEGITSINYKSFYGCTNLKSVVLPNSLLEIDTQAFALCYSLKEIVIPENVKFLFDSCFFDCAHLEKVVFKGTPLTIDDLAFLGCDNIKTIEAPFKYTYEKDPYFNITKFTME